jgi:capsular polysaccharide transport system permease protein
MTKPPAVPDPTVTTRVSVQLQVIGALMIRNVMAKYGRGNLGFLWLVVEPIFLVGGVIVIWVFLHRGGHGVSVAAFVLSGYMPLTLWRHLSNAVRVMSGNYGLLYHRRITIFDIMIARALTEIAGISAAGIIVYLVLLSIGSLNWIAEPSLLLAGWLIMSFFAFGVGCITAGLSERSEVLENLIQPAQYLLMPISGCFFMVSWLPKQAQDLVLFIPMVHMYEMVRDGIFGREVTTHYSFLYAIIWTFIALFLGFASINSSRKKLSFR